MAQGTTPTPTGPDTVPPADPDTTPPADPDAPKHADSTGAEDEPTGSNTAVHGDHDRVAMLSLCADGTPDQLNPEFIGDAGSALAATSEQFRQQAVSAADTAARTEQPADEDDAEQDPTVAALTEAHEAAASAAEDAAKRAVEGLTR